MGEARTQQVPVEIEVDHLRLGEKLREAREYLGLSQEFVSDQLDIPRPSISAIETGKRKVSGLELRDFARLYKRPVSYFLEENRPEEPEDETTVALYRAARTLNEEDREQVLRFAQFLKGAGKVPSPPTKRDSSRGKPRVT